MNEARPIAEEKTPFALSECQHMTWRASCKLRAIGEVFERQVDSAADGYPEMIGLGMVIGDLGADLEKLAHALDVIVHSTTKNDGGTVIAPWLRTPS